MVLGAQVPADATEAQVEMAAIRGVQGKLVKKDNVREEATEVLVVQQSRMDYLVV